MPKLKPHTILPTSEEDSKIREAVERDPDARLLEDGNIKLVPFGKLKDARRRGRPVADSTKIPVNIRYSPDVIEAFRSTGNGWQTRMNAALQDWLKDHRPDDIKLT